MQYVTGSGDDEGCIFCKALSEGDDVATGVLYRGANVFVILNAFPYNTGHLMVAPLRHTEELAGLRDDERNDLMTTTSDSVEILKQAMSPHGFNIGINLGQVAGAGVPGHVHMHVVPRWGGDTNFMAVVGQTKVLPEMISDTQAKLRPLFERL
jgi:ATP adenylyltransferase